MNAQAYILQNHGILNITWSAVDNFLSRHRGFEYSSNQIFYNLPLALRRQLTLIASSYSNGACSSAPSYVGVVASMLAKNNPNFFHDYHHFCPILRRFDDGFMKN